MGFRRARMVWPSPRSAVHEYQGVAVLKCQGAEVLRPHTWACVGPPDKSQQLQASCANLMQSKQRTRSIAAKGSSQNKRSTSVRSGWADGVVPVAVEVVRGEIDLVHLRIGHFDPLRIGPFVDL